MPTPSLLSRLPAPARGCVALFLLWCVCASAIAQDVPYRVEIEAPGALRKLLLENLDIVRWQEKSDVSRDVFMRLFRDAPRDIEKLLATEGYYSPRIRSSLERDAQPPLARFEIDPGEPVRVASVNIGFTGHIADQSSGDQAQIDKARASWDLPPGRVFRQADWEKAKRDLLRALLIYRFPAARLADTRATVDPRTRTARLDLTVDSGPEFSFGQLDIEGLERYPSSVIENLSPIEPGAPYDQEQVLRFQQALQQTPYFKNVFVNVDVSPQQAKAAPVHVSVVEQESKRVGFGIGYSTDTGVRGRIAYTDLNIRDRAWRFTSAIEADRLSQAIAGSLYFPLKANRIQDSLDASYAHRNLAGEITDTVRVGASRAQPVGRFDRVLSLQYQYEEQEVGGVLQDIREALVLNSAWTRRRLDNLLYPRKGYVLNMQLGGAHDAVLSDQSFLRAYGRGLRYYPLGDRANLIVRGEVGAVEARSRTGIPSDFLFRAGGDQSVRGYAYQSLGVPVEGAILGGRYLAVASVEYDYWFRERWGAAIFYDTGDAADSWSALEFVEGYGVGARWRSPVGLVNLDIAYGRETRDTRFHFSVGFVF